MISQYEKLNIFILRFTIALLFILIIPLNSYSQENKKEISERDKYITVANEIIEKAHYCALITLDQFGQPHIRTMEPFQPKKDMVIWLGTNSKSRKVQEIRNNSQVTLFYS
ncbi:MAG: pyridoxamine 5'-phosphate oxidase family protein, partial [Candidatus Neomarinimicrobiota bacterium]